MDRHEKFSEKLVLDGKIFAVISYLSILCIIPLVFKKDNDFVLSHGKQGLVLFIAQVAVFILSVIFEWLVRPLTFVIGIFSLWGMIQALQGKYVRLPVISDIADRITL